jgi:hypothetical protein
MKTSIYLLLVLLLFSMACQQKKTLNFIPGVYVNHSKGSYSVADDTLVIHLLEGSKYEILRRTGFNRVVDGKAGKREYETETWNGVYDAGTGVVNESRYGKVLSFFPDSGLLRVGNRTYKKIK